MCGRFALGIPKKRLTQFFQAQLPMDLPPRANIAPGTPILIILRPKEDSPAREGHMIHWGLVPFWAKDEKIGYRTINARSESVEDKPAFREAFKRRRCLIPAEGFYEWEKRPKPEKNVPHFFSLTSDEPMALAGLWERWEKPDGELLHTATILTVEANLLVGQFHERMPVILSPGDYDLWLDRQTATAEAKALLKTYPAELMREHVLDIRFNAPGFEQGSLLESSPPEPDEDES